jgi:hypothetical protein
MWKRCAKLRARQWTGCCVRNTRSPTLPLFWDRDGMVITLWYPTAPVSLRPDVISDAGARLRPDWRPLDFDSDAVTGGEKCRDSQKNKSAPSSEWPPA